MANIEKENLLTQEYVKELFDYHEDGYLVWKVSKCINGKSKVGDKAGWVFQSHSGPRHCVRIYGRTFYTARIIFFWWNGYFPEIVDHKDRDNLNNRIENLRAATGLQNARNYTKPINGKTSIYKGVCFNKSENKWRAQINVNKKRTLIGRFITETEAAAAYNKSALEHYGEFSNLNIII